MKKHLTNLSLVILTAGTVCAAENVLLEENLETSAPGSKIKQVTFNWGKPAGTSMTVSDKAAASGKKALQLTVKKGGPVRAAYAFNLPKGTQGKKKTLKFKVMLPSDQYMGWELLTGSKENVFYFRIEKGTVIATAQKGKERVSFGKIIEPKTWYTFKLELPNDGKSPVSLTVTNPETGDSVTKQIKPTTAKLTPDTYLRFFCTQAKEEDLVTFFDDFRYTEEQ